MIELRSSPHHPLGDAVETFIRSEDAKRFIEEVGGDDPEVASYVRIEEREARGKQAELGSTSSARATRQAGFRDRRLASASAVRCRRHS